MRSREKAGWIAPLFREEIRGRRKKSFFVIKFNNERCRPVIKELESGETLASIELYGLASTKIEEEA